MSSFVKLIDSLKANYVHLRDLPDEMVNEFQKQIARFDNTYHYLDTADSLLSAIAGYIANDRNYYLNEQGKEVVSIEDMEQLLNPLWQAFFNTGIMPVSTDYFSQTMREIGNKIGQKIDRAFKVLNENPFLHSSIYYSSSSSRRNKNAYLEKSESKYVIKIIELAEDYIASALDEIPELEEDFIDAQLELAQAYLAETGVKSDNLSDSEKKGYATMSYLKAFEIPKELEKDFNNQINALAIPRQWINDVFIYCIEVAEMLKLHDPKAIEKFNLLFQTKGLPFEFPIENDSYIYQPFTSETLIDWRNEDFMNFGYEFWNYFVKSFVAYAGDIAGVYMIDDFVEYVLEPVEDYYDMFKIGNWTEDDLRECGTHLEISAERYKNVFHDNINGVEKRIKETQEELIDELNNAEERSEQKSAEEYLDNIKQVTAYAIQTLENSDTRSVQKTISSSIKLIEQDLEELAIVSDIPNESIIRTQIEEIKSIAKRRIYSDMRSINQIYTQKEDAKIVFSKLYQSLRKISANTLKSMATPMYRFNTGQIVYVEKRRKYGKIVGMGLENGTGKQYYYVYFDGNNQTEKYYRNELRLSS